MTIHPLSFFLGVATTLAVLLVFGIGAFVGARIAHAKA